MKAKNEPVGKSECPIKGCQLEVIVYKYRSTSEDQNKRRFAGRLYCVCEKHGRVENQEFLLEHIQWSKGTGADVPASATPPPPVKTPQKAAPRPAPPKAPNPPAPPEPPPKKKGGWLPNFFGESE